MRLEIESLFPQKTFHFEFASTSEKAVDLINAELFDFIFLDMRLPDQSGIATVRQCAKELGRARVVIMTGYSDAVILEEIMGALAKLPIQGFLLKSHTAATLSALFKHFENDLPGPFICPDGLAMLNSFESNELTKREIEILKMASKGMTTPEIAAKLGCSQETVKTHRSNLLLKTKTRNFAELSAWYSSRYSGRS
ncbi:MAG: response regulator transcription factor [Proteobacteria bacterium]|nr:MAG: response regulator transcription factor [Pseudomonadota bacterium]